MIPAGSCLYEDHALEERLRVEARRHIRSPEQIHDALCSLRERLSSEPSEPIDEEKFFRRWASEHEGHPVETITPTIKATAPEDPPTVEPETPRSFSPYAPNPMTKAEAMREARKLGFDF